jgi:hypothetical protein
MHFVPSRAQPRARCRNHSPIQPRSQWLGKARSLGALRPWTSLPHLWGGLPLPTHLSSPAGNTRWIPLCCPLTSLRLHRCWSPPCLTVRGWLTWGGRMSHTPPPHPTQIIHLRLLLPQVSHIPWARVAETQHTPSRSAQIILLFTLLIG